MVGRRQANALGLVACLGALGFALWSQYDLGVVPCHLCIFQRVTVLALALAFAAALLLSSGPRRGVLHAALIGLAGLATLATSGRHVWIQLQPPGSVAACGADLDFMLDVFPLTEVILKVFQAGGECAKVDFTFLGLSMPAWVFVFALAVTAGGIWANLRLR
ncbi:MAG: disulfide bond formation protein B [Gammaproteobacteria bacterium]|nr:disulfide bond formation protein B [Gammaproteobacteria bacterium]